MTIPRIGTNTANANQIGSVTAAAKGAIWADLAARIPADLIAWRQDGRPIARDGKFFARFVAYVEANTVRERLDAVVPGDWDLTLEPMKEVLDQAGEIIDESARCSFKARLRIMGVTREDVGSGKDYKQASTDAFKRVAVRFGIAHELYDYEQNWVRVDGDGKYAKPLEDPSDAYARRLARVRNGEEPKESGEDAHHRARTAAQESTQQRIATHEANNAGKSENAEKADNGIRGGAGDPTPLDVDEPSCPKCGRGMWDNRITKRNPKAPDYKCRSRSCDGVIWPPRPGEESSSGSNAPVPPPTPSRRGDEFEDFPSALNDEDDDLPF